MSLRREVNVGDFGWVGGTDAAVDEAAFFEGAEADGEEASGDAFGAAAEGAEAHRAVVAEEPEDVERPGASEHFEEAAHAAAYGDGFCLLDVVFFFRSCHGGYSQRIGYCKVPTSEMRGTYLE
jgi:hypothetical protein